MEAGARSDLTGGWAGGRAGGWEGPLSCLVSALVSCRVRVFPVFGTPDSGIVTAFGLTGTARAGQGMARLQDPRALPKIATPGMGRRAGWLLKPNNKPWPEPKPGPSPHLVCLGMALAPEERSECRVVSVSLVTIGVDEDVVPVLRTCTKTKHAMHGADKRDARMWAR